MSRNGSQSILVAFFANFLWPTLLTWRCGLCNVVAMHTSIAGYRIATSQTLAEVARRFGVNKSTVLRWERDLVPAERVPDVERQLGIPRYYLRPDLWPKECPTDYEIAG